MPSPALHDHSPRALKEVALRRGDDLDALKDLRGELLTVANSLRASLEDIDSGQLRMRVRDYAKQFEDWISDTIESEIQTIEAAEMDSRGVLRVDRPGSAQ